MSHCGLKKDKQRVLLCSDLACLVSYLRKKNLFEVHLVVLLGFQKTAIMAIVSSGRKQKVDKSEARRKLRESRNYDPLAHRKEDAQRSRDRASMDTKELYRGIVKLYEEYVLSIAGLGLQADFHILGSLRVKE